MKSNRLLLLSVICSTFIIGCSSSKLHYQIDPDLSLLSPAFINHKIIYVSVDDKRNNDAVNITKASITAEVQDSEALKSKLIQYLKDNQFKIINRVLLADIGLEIRIIKLKLSIDDGIFKSKIIATSEFEIVIHKKSERWSRTFRASRSQEIANPVNEYDATGVINQMLSKQFNNIFSDRELLDFISQ